MPLAFDQLDRTVDQLRVEVVDLLLRQLDLLERRGDLVIGQKPLLHHAATSRCSPRRRHERLPPTTQRRATAATVRARAAVPRQEPRVRRLHHRHETTRSPRASRSRPSHSERLLACPRRAHVRVAYQLFRDIRVGLCLEG